MLDDVLKEIGKELVIQVINDNDANYKNNRTIVSREEENLR